MPFRQRLRTTGRPPSGNGASSAHLWWDVPRGPWVEAETVLEVLIAPAVPALHFWALQVSFQQNGKPLGGAHTGLQWIQDAPEGAVNWGGYADSVGELPGSRSALPPAGPGPNTVRWPWWPGRPYRLQLRAARPGVWSSTVTDLADGRSAHIRDLFVDADAFTGPVVWSEVFADCGAPSSVVRWSSMVLTATDGSEHRPTSVTVTYQTHAAGGCDNTDAVVDEVGVRQVTSVSRRTMHGAVLRLPA